MPYFSCAWKQEGACFGRGGTWWTCHCQCGIRRCTPTFVHCNASEIIQQSNKWVCNGQQEQAVSSPLSPPLSPPEKVHSDMRDNTAHSWGERHTSNISFKKGYVPAPAIVRTAWTTGLIFLSDRMAENIFIFLAIWHKNWEKEVLYILTPEVHVTMSGKSRDWLHQIGTWCLVALHSLVRSARSTPMGLCILCTSASCSYKYLFFLWYYSKVSLLVLGCALMRGRVHSCCFRLRDTFKFFNTCNLAIRVKSEKKNTQSIHNLWWKMMC